MASNPYSPAAADAATADGPPDPFALADATGVPRDAIERVEVLSRRHGHALWRLVTSARSYVLKWLPAPAARVELGAYRVLHLLGVPTVRLLASTSQALLLDDVGRGESWRLAEERDAASPAAAERLAAWYLDFHQAGAELVAQGGAPAYLTRETDLLTEERLLAAGRRLGVADAPAWLMALDDAEDLRSALAQRETTLNHNDFAWTNLALSRRDDAAIVFDYHLLGLGARASDVRNVTSTLTAPAADAFAAAYGELDPVAVVLDRPLATLHALVVASQQPNVPRWAHASRDEVIDGTLARALSEARDTVSTA